MMSGFSQRDCCSGAACTQDCTDLFVPGVEFQGSNITEVQASSVLSCQSACTQNPYCHFFTFHTKGWSLDKSVLTCYLKKSDSGLPTGISSLTNVLSGFTKKPSEFNKSDKDCADFLLPDFDFPGGDIDYILASDARHCQRICTQHPRCQFFTYSTEQSPSHRRFSCNLKRSETKIPVTITPLLNAVSGFSLTSTGVQKDGKECASLMLPGVDFNGDDLAITTAPDVYRCQALCTSHAQCQFFTYGLSTRCVLKRSGTGIPTLPLISASYISGFSLMASGVQKGAKGCSDLILPGVNFPGVDIELVLAVDAMSCQLLCTYHPRCRFFTYYPRERASAGMRFSCYLKGGTSDLPTAVQANSETVSGFSYFYHGTQKPCNTYTYSNTEFPGYGERTLPTATFELCREACTRDPSCQFFSYATTAYADASKQGTCYPKNVMSLPKPDRLDLVPNVTSGFPLRKCEGDIQGYVPPLPTEIPDSTCYFN